MFTDLVGSTALSTKLDPEDLPSVIGEYQKCVAQTVGLFGGFVARYMGDGVLIYFGYPQAHEDDAERAAAMLELQCVIPIEACRCTKIAEEPSWGPSRLRPEPGVASPKESAKIS
jgi:class 3 adenylate cyclase